MNRKNTLIILASAFLTVVIAYTLYFSLAPYMRLSRGNPQFKDDIATRQASGSAIQKLPKLEESVAKSQAIRDEFQDVQPSRLAQPESKESSETPSRADRAVIRRTAIAKDVENREPIGVSQRVSVRQQRVYCWMHVVNGQGGRIIVRWTRRGNKITETQLPVGSNSWRTWAYASLRPSMVGPARVEILDESGELLKTLSFKITE